MEGMLSTFAEFEKEIVKNLKSLINTFRGFWILLANLF